MNVRFNIKDANFIILKPKFNRETAAYLRISEAETNRVQIATMAEKSNRIVGTKMAKLERRWRRCERK
jgi:hypothetical protein